MPRKRLMRSAHHFYHVTTRSNHKHWFRLPLEQVWRMCMEALLRAHQYHPVNIAQFVLMANHYHLLIRTPNNDLDRFMYYFNKRLSERLRQKTGLENRMFGGRYHWSLIEDDRYLKNVISYIFQNPLRAGLVERCEDYPYSTLWYQRRGKRWCLELEPLFDLDECFFEFINRPLEAEGAERLRKGLKRRQFKEVFPRRY